MGLAIHLLGVPRVERDGVALPGPRGRKAWAVLAYLLRSTGPVSRHQLSSLLFEDAEDPLAAVRWNLSELRRVLGDAALRGELLQVALEPADDVDVRSVACGTWSEALSAPGLGRELLEGMAFSSSPAFEVWLAAERRNLQAAAEAVLREAALAKLAAGARQEACDLAARLVAHNPLEENYQALLVRSLAAAGDGVGAARQVAICRDLFQRELGVAPGPTLQAAERALTASPMGRPASGRAAVAAQIEAGEAALCAGALEAGLQCLRRAIVEADDLGDALLRTRSRVALGGALVRAARGQDEEGAIALHEALAVGEEAASPCAAACRELGYVEFLRGRYERALGWLDRGALFAAGDRSEEARIATVRGSILTDTAHYGPAASELTTAEALAMTHTDPRQQAYTLSMVGRAWLLRGDMDAAAAVLDRSIALAEHGATALLPWPQALRAEVDLLRGDLTAAQERFEHAFALGCQLGDPCWEGIAARGLGLVAARRGNASQAVELLVDSVARCVRLPDAYLWGKAYALDALCGVAVAAAMPQASVWIDELQKHSSRSGMRELTVRAHLHRASLGDAASAAAARALAEQIDSPVLRRLAGVQATA